ncbi:MAG: hypothetical protein RDU25_06290 [Patescibacteria group bacterium]|nr:hypothetical protein [Patescibacteria group bacterium]
MRKILSKISLVAIVLSTMLVGMPVGASGVAVTLTPNSSSSSPTDVTIAWTGSAIIPSGNTVTITAAGAGTITFSSGTPATVDLDGDATPDGTLTSTSTNSATYTLSAPTTLLTNSLELSVAFPAGAYSYSIAVFVSGIADFGAALFYANGSNQVSVTATVPATLSLAITPGTDVETLTNSCNLGTLTTAASSTCSYRLLIGTNAASGFQATIAANADLNYSGSATITQVVDNAASNPGNAEQYGIEVYGATTGGRVAGGAYTGAVTENNPTGYTFGTDTSPVPTSTQNFISYNDAFDRSNATLAKSTLVKHFANITSGTPAGSYSQTVTYYVTATY